MVQNNYTLSLVPSTDKETKKAILIDLLWEFDLEICMELCLELALLVSWGSSRCSDALFDLFDLVELEDLSDFADDGRSGSETDDNMPSWQFEFYEMYLF